jgi:hypothetical protein
VSSQWGPDPDEQDAGPRRPVVDGLVVAVAVVLIVMVGVAVWRLAR